MAREAAAGSITPEVRLLAIEITRGLPQQDRAGEACALSCFVRDHIRYVRDVVGVETVQTPQATLEIGAGDCDDKATLLASLLMSIGFKAVFVVLNQGGQYTHVWTLTKIGRTPLHLETTIPVLCGETAKIGEKDRLIFWPIAPYDVGGRSR